MAEGFEDFGRRQGSWRARWRPVGVIAVACFRADPWRATLSLLLRGSAAISPPLFAAALAALVDAAARPGPGAGRDTVGPAVVLAFAVAARFVFDQMGWRVAQVLQERTSHYVDLRIIEMVAGLPGVEHHERPIHLDKLERIRQEHWALSGAVFSLMSATMFVFQVGASVLLLASVDIRLLLLPVFALPALWAGSRAERMRIKFLEETQSEHRRTFDLFKLATRAAPAKELRVFNLGPEILRRHRATSDILIREEESQRFAAARLEAAGRSVFALGYVGAITFVAAGVTQGRLSVGDLVLTIVLAGQLMAQLRVASGYASWVATTLTAVRRYTWLLDYAAAARAAVGLPGPPVEPPERALDGIRFEGVDFRYPGTNVEVLSGVDLFLPAGSTVAIVGDNGAGKTTLVKLLTRMYEPTAGAITLDGVPLARFDLAALRARMSAAFQDHARLEFIARETVGVGDLSHLDDDAVVHRALERGGSEDVLDDLPAGLAQQLGAGWEDGVDLSGGQWQKLALGRGMMRPAPLLLVLDEPTAALDAETEHRLFDRYVAAARRGAASAGTITLLVSHRFSTVRNADLIVVISQGRVVEQGSHENLLAANGLYAELYRMQARAYR